MKIIYGALATLVLLSIHSAPQAQSCTDRARKLSAQWERQISCYCDRDLSRLVASLPKGLSLVAACGLHDAGGRMLDPRRESVNMDRHDASASMPDGVFYVSGDLTLSGSISVEPGNSGEVWFRPDVPLVQGRRAFSEAFQELKIENETDYVKLQVTKALLAKECSMAKATVTFSGFRVHRGQTDEAGTYPSKMKVLRLGKYTSCASH
jgi:hypothetical protein